MVGLSDCNVTMINDTQILRYLLAERELQENFTSIEPMVSLKEPCPIEGSIGVS